MKPSGFIKQRKRSHHKMLMKLYREQNTESNRIAFVDWVLCFIDDQTIETISEGLEPFKKEKK